MRTEISLNGNDWKLVEFRPNMWLMRGLGPYEPENHAWVPATVPGVVQADLIAAGRLPAEPYRDLNSRLCEWVSNRDWGYFKSFAVPKELEGKKSRLHFEGVDYRCRIFLNGELLGEHEGMYTPFEFDVSQKLNYGEENRLAVAVFRAPDEHSQVGFTSEVKTHKSRMPYSWDFSTRMVPLGIWDEVKLIATGPSHLTDVWVRTDLADDLSKAEIGVEVSIASEACAEGTLIAEILRNGNPVGITETPVICFAGDTHAQARVLLANPEIWWPNQLGQQPLYEARVFLRLPDGQISDERTVRFGIRRIRAIANEGAPADALPYTLEVNGTRIFIKGWNWVPMDHLYGVDLAGKYRRMIQLAKDANINLLRVWGGGLIEKELFYDLCDEAGILVWQEFILSSSGPDNKPSTDPAFLNLLGREAEQIVPRRRNHPSLAIWCGGNELMFLDGRPIDVTEPAIALMKSVVERLDPERIFLPSSPSGPVFSGGSSSLGRQHDVHGPWQYGGPEAHYRHFNDEIDALLHSEFGTDGAISWKSMQKFVSPEWVWPPERTNEVWVHHGDWWINVDRVKELFGPLNEIQSFIRASQYTQMEGLRYQIEANMRRMWRCSGTIPWQMNEPWPNTSCTCSVDYYTDPKPAYYAVMRAYEPLHVSAKYEAIQWHGREEFEAEIWLTSARPSLQVTVRAQLLGLSGESLVPVLETETESPNAGAMCVTRLHWPIKGYQGPFVLFLQVLDRDGKLLSESSYLHSNAPAPGFSPLQSAPETTLAARVNGDEIILTNTGKAVALMVEVDEEVETGRFVSLSDNFLLIPPGGERRLTLRTSGWRGTLAIQGWNTNALAVEIG